MDKLEKFKQLYFYSVSEMLEDPLRWKEFLQYAGNMYKYDFVTLVTAVEQNKSFTKLATYDLWQSVGGQVKRGENLVLYLFDILSRKCYKSLKK